jgi:RNA polymerase sigma factor (sigma-70 family)
MSGKMPNNWSVYTSGQRSVCTRVISASFVRARTPRTLARNRNCRTMASMGRPSTSNASASREVLEDLYRELAPAVLGYLRGSGAAEPEDLLGDVFVAVIRGLPSCGGDPAAIRRWVFTVAHHRLVDERRKLMTRSRDVAFDVQHEPCADDCYDEVLNRISASPAVRALETLTADQRSVVLLRDVADLSVADTAHVLGKKAGAVKTTHRRALAALSSRVTGEAVR